MKPVTVLIAVPDLLFRSKLRDAAGHAGAETVSAAKHELALQRVREMQPAFLLVDLGDERIEPFELIQEVKSDPATATTHVVGFFAHVRIDLRDAAREAGCDTVVTRSAVVAAVAELVGGVR